MLNRLISVAPMMDCTDRHFRYLVRLLSRRVLLYSEMVTANAIIYGDRDKLLGFSAQELPLALQLGGSDPDALAMAAAIGEDYGYSEINLNVGCPSNRVQSGRFGACLMQEPQRVADCVAALANRVSLPVTVKTRIGVDDCDAYQFLHDFVTTVAAAGCQTFMIHARKAWLQGLSPKQNRTLPPLDYGRVYQLKRDFPQLEIIINGGISDDPAITTHLQQVDGVMIGREAYRHLFWLAEFDARYYGEPSQERGLRDVLEQYWPYLVQQAQAGVSIKLLVKHLLGLFQGMPGARHWRRALCEKSREADGLRELELIFNNLS